MYISLKTRLYDTYYVCTIFVYSDVDECADAIASGTDLCNSAGTGRVCSNTVGSSECICPGGSELTNGVCGK